MIPCISLLTCKAKWCYKRILAHLGVVEFEIGGNGQAFHKFFYGRQISLHIKAFSSDAIYEPKL